MTSVRLFLAILALVLSTHSTAWADHASDQRRLQELVEALRMENAIPGISVAIARGGSRPLLAAAGFSDVENEVPVTPETSFFIGSVSKNLFAAVVLMLSEEELIGLDDPLSKFIEWPRGDEVTVRMLLDHTSGIPEYMTEEIFQADEGDIPEFFKKRRSPTDILAMMPSHELLFDPGSKQDYCNTNFILVGLIIEKVTEKPLAVVLEERVAKPIRLERMFLYGESTAARARASGYSGATQWGAVDGELVDCTFADNALPDSADGSVVTSAADLLGYHRALRNGELLTPTSWEAMNTVKPGMHNGLSYLLGEGLFGPYAGNVGRAMGHVAFSVYFSDHDLYVVMLLNRGDSQIKLGQLLEPWLDTGASH